MKHISHSQDAGCDNVFVEDENLIEGVLFWHHNGIRYFVLTCKIKYDMKRNYLYCQRLKYNLIREGHNVWESSEDEDEDEDGAKRGVKILNFVHKHGGKKMICLCPQIGNWLFSGLQLDKYKFKL